MLREKITWKGAAVLLTSSIFFCLPFMNCFLNCLNDFVQRNLDNMGIERSSAYINLCHDKDFIGGATWTFTAVVSAFLVAFYSQQSAKHYGVSTRKTIALTIGSYTIPICIIINFTAVVFMTFDYYLNQLEAFYCRAFFSLIYQAVISWMCILLTSDAHSAKTIKREELRWLDQEIKKQENDETAEGQCKDSYYYTMPLILRGKEMVSDRLELVEEILSELKPSGVFTTDAEYLRYQKDTIKHIVDWAKEEKVNTRLVYDSIQHIIGRLETSAGNEKYSFSKELPCVVSPRTAILLSLMRVAMQEEQFQGLWDFLLSNLLKESIYEKKQAYYLARTTFVFTLQNEGKDIRPEIETVLEKNNKINQWKDELGLYTDDAEESSENSRRFQTAMAEWAKNMLREYGITDDTTKEQIVNIAFKSQNLRIESYSRVQERRERIYRNDKSFSTDEYTT